jgi:hypothetical protein
MYDLPNQCWKLFFANEYSKKTNQLAIKSKSTIYIFPFNEISLFQININLEMVVFFIGNYRIWFRYKFSDQHEFFNLIRKNNYIMVSKHCYVKLDECSYIDTKTSSLVLKNSLVINNIFQVETIAKQFQNTKKVGGV